MLEAARGGRRCGGSSCPGRVWRPCTAQHANVDESGPPAHLPPPHTHQHPHRPAPHPSTPSPPTLTPLHACVQDAQGACTLLRRRRRAAPADRRARVARPAAAAHGGGKQVQRARARVWVRALCNFDPTGSPPNPAKTHPQPTPPHPHPTPASLPGAASNLPVKPPGAFKTRGQLSAADGHVLLLEQFEVRRQAAAPPRALGRRPRGIGAGGTRTSPGGLPVATRAPTPALPSFPPP